MSFRNAYTEIVFNAMRLEKIPISITQTDELVKGISKAGLNDIQSSISLNFINALSYVNSKIDSFDKYQLLDYAKNINNYINNGLDSEAGRIRSGLVRVGKYYPEGVDEYKVRQILYDNLDNILSNPLYYFALASRGQWFNDGNKRTSLLVTNLILQSRDKAKYFTIDATRIDEFSNQLIDYYNSNNIEQFLKYLQQFIMTLAVYDCNAEDSDGKLVW